MRTIFFIYASLVICGCGKDTINTSESKVCEAASVSTAKPNKNFYSSCNSTKASASNSIGKPDSAIICDSGTTVFVYSSSNRFIAFTPVDDGNCVQSDLPTGGLRENLTSI